MTLIKWSEKWHMIFNFRKCKCLYTGPGHVGIVQFRSRDIKLDVMKRRRVLKGSCIVIADDLCNDLLNTYNHLKQHPDCKKGWSWDGQLFAEPRLQEGVVVGWSTVCRAEDGPRRKGSLGGIARGSCRAIRCTQVSLCV